MRYLIILILLSIISCNNDKKTIDKGGIGKKEEANRIVDYFEIKAPSRSDTIVCNALVDFKIA